MVNNTRNIVCSRLKFAAALTAAFLLLGCGKESASDSKPSNKVRIGYIGLTCEAPIFTAIEKGFFKEEIYFAIQLYLLL